MKLQYVGEGFLPGVPARDLTEEEAQHFGGEKVLIASGLWADKSQLWADKSQLEKDGEAAKTAGKKDGIS